MPDQPQAVATALEYLHAFARGDMDAVRTLVTEDVVFESPRTRVEGADAVLAEIGGFAQAVTGIEVIDAHGDAERALVMYDMATGPFGTIRAADHVTLRDGKVAADRLLFDTALLGAADAG